ncbi:MAG TPA: thioredoxin domain-containing protein [Steroidobacteraceae bacterium]|nr:thioredoxin domain-containing protein [Steroidobacteraceae bacterium]
MIADTGFRGSRAAAAALLALIVAGSAARGAAAGGEDRGFEPVELRLDPAEPALGKVTAPLTMVEFTDYQCPYCRRFEAEVFPKLRHDYIDTGKLRFIARDLPLEIHAAAQTAAEAAHCAGEQGRFWEMHAALLGGAGDLAQGGIEARAKALGLDLPRFRACVAQGKYASVIEAHVREADSVGINGTPGFIIGRAAHGVLTGQRLEGAAPYASFDSYLRELLARR